MSRAKEKNKEKRKSNETIKYKATFFRAPEAAESSRANAPGIDAQFVSRRDALRRAPLRPSRRRADSRINELTG